MVSTRQPSAGAGSGLDAGTPTAPRSVLYFIALDTSDPRADVASYYEEEVDKDPWQLEDAVSTKDLDVYRFSSVEDADITGAVVIARGQDDGRTSVFISLADAGAEIADEPPYEPGESLSLPKEFPEDVPVYEGATITSTAFFQAPGNQGFLLVLVTTDSQDDVIEFYRSEFEDLGWTVEDTGGANLASGIDFRDGGGDIQGSVTADRFAQDRDFTEVRIQVQTTPGREPSPGDGEDDTTPTEEETPERSPTAPASSS